MVKISRLNFLSLFSAEVWFRHGAQGLVKILKLKFGQYFEAGAYLRFDNFYRTRVRSLFTLVTNSLTDSLTDSCLVNLIDVTLACEDANSKLVDVVTVADEDRVDKNLLHIWKLRFGQKAKLLFKL